jgi:hypothetical protein
LAAHLDKVGGVAHWRTLRFPPIQSLARLVAKAEAIRNLGVMRVFEDVP